MSQSYSSHETGRPQPTDQQPLQQAYGDLRNWNEWLDGHEQSIREGVRWGVPTRDQRTRLLTNRILRDAVNRTVLVPIDQDGQHRVVSVRTFGSNDKDARQVIWESGSPHTGAHYDESYLRKTGIRLHAIDRPGYFLSTPQPGYSVIDAASDIPRVADEVGATEYFVAGCSGGTPTAIMAGTLQDERLRGVLVTGPIAPPGSVEDPTAGLIASNLAHRQTGYATSLPPIVEEFSDKDLYWQAVYGTAADEWSKKFKRQPRKLAQVRAELAMAIQGPYGNAQPAGWVDDSTANNIKEWGGDLADVTCRAWVIGYGKDEHTPVQNAKALAGLLPPDLCQLTVLENEQHIGHKFLPWIGMMIEAVEHDKPFPDLTKVKIQNKLRFALRRLLG